LAEEPAFDLRYSIEDFPEDGRRDSEYLYQRIDEVMTKEGAAPGGRTLDVASGIGKLVNHLYTNGTETWGLDPSAEMLGLSRWVYPRDSLILLRGIGESLPFLDGTFDRVVCQGSLDHFVDPSAFMKEAVRVLKPDGRLVIALANYESLSCIVGRTRHWIGQRTWKRPPPPKRFYWDPPPDHFHKGDLPFVRKLGGSWFQLERCYGVSMLWLSVGWAGLLERLPDRLANGLLKASDGLAYRVPRFADMIISVWRPKAVRPKEARRTDGAVPVQG
jgi:SAM-dependent methyltransferase